MFTGDQSLHALFQQQVRQTLDQSDLDEDAKQAILVAMNCPCCGAGGMNYTAKINRKRSNAPTSRRHFTAIASISILKP